MYRARRAVIHSSSSRDVLSPRADFLVVGVAPNWIAFAAFADFPVGVLRAGTEHDQKSVALSDKNVVQRLKNVLEDNDDIIDTTDRRVVFTALTLSGNILANTSFLLKERPSLQIEIFPVSRLKQDVTQHEIVPPHRLATPEEIKNLRAADLPVLLTTDPVARWYAFPRGSIVHISRKDKLIGEYSYFRVVQ